MSSSVAAPALTQSARSILTQVVTKGSVTRPEMGARLGLSRPTLSSATAELEKADLVVQSDVSKGATGRSAAVYSMSPRAGYVVGLDIGSTTIRLMAMTLDGRVLAERSHRRTKQGRTDAAAPLVPAATLLGKSLASLGDTHGPLRAVAVAIPNVVVKADVPYPEGEEWRRLGRAVLDKASVPATVPVHVANNVNCSALAEHHVGCAVDRSHSVYLQVGMNIGLGIVVDGELLVGANGAAGEVSGLPFPWRAGTPYVRERMEEHLGALGWMDRVHSAWKPADGPRPDRPEDVLKAAEDGSSRARKLVTAHAQEVGMMAASVIAILDPGLVVLGGGIGQHPLIASEVRQLLGQYPWPTEVRTSTLGATATARGATHLAARDALSALLGN